MKRANHACSVPGALVWELSRAKHLGGRTLAWSEAVFHD
jgi:hypothetical protein